MRGLPSIVQAYVDQLKSDATTLEEMAGIYPGDLSGEMSEDAYLLRAMVDSLGNVDWFELISDYQNKWPTIEVTVDNV